MQLSQLYFKCCSIIVCVLMHYVNSEVKDANNITKEAVANLPLAVLYDTGVKDYLDNDYAGCVQKLELAVDVYNANIGKLRRCYQQCNEQVSYTEPLYKVDIEDLLHYEKAIKNTLCLLKCKKRNGILDIWKHIDDNIIRVFEKRKPYDYLHVCYAHRGEFQQAANAAFTYLVANPNDEGVLASLQHYAGQDGVDANEVINREAKDYVYLYVHGTRAYEEKRWDEVVQNMEASLESFLQEEEECRAQCEGPFEQPPNDFIANVANHFTHALICKRKCNDKLSTLNGEKHDDLLPSHYHYLQFAYFKIGKLKEACKAVASYLLFYPGDKTMMHNIDYYSTLPKVEKDDFQPRPEALKYIHRHTYESKIVDYITNVFAVETVKLLQNSDEEKMSSKEHHEEWFDFKEQNSFINRFSIRNFTTPQECTRLMHVAEYFALDGDGYQVGGGSPHTEHENYYGLSLKRAAKLWRLKELDDNSIKLLLNVTEKMKKTLELHFDVTKQLHYAYTHLVCRSAKSNARNRTDFSHPVHADNCNIQVNGTCLKQWPAFTWRDYTAILYLNDEFRGGDLFFSKDYFGKHVEHIIKPTCGRLVGFTSGGENLHGVRAITEGKRCAMAIWFTYDRHHAENDRKMLNHISIPNK